MFTTGFAVFLGMLLLMVKLPRRLLLRVRIPANVTAASGERDRGARTALRGVGL